MKLPRLTGRAGLSWAPAALVLSLSLLAGCTGPPRQARGGRGAPEEPGEGLDEDQLRDLITLSPQIVVARVEELDSSGGVVRLRLRVRESLKGPATVGQEVQASDFLFEAEGGRSRTIGPLVELSHYLFFLAPGAEESSPWIHLRDPAEDPMPAAQPLVERVEALVGEAPPPDDLPRGPEGGDE